VFVIINIIVANVITPSSSSSSSAAAAAAVAAAATYYCLSNGRTLCSLEQYLVAVNLVRFNIF